MVLEIKNAIPDKLSRGGKVSLDPTVVTDGTAEVTIARIDLAGWLDAGWHEVGAEPAIEPTPVPEPTKDPVKPSGKTGSKAE
jgi:hypothetical protein